jgi:lactoylglutathione lyase
MVTIRKIDCVMLPVTDLDRAATLYIAAFGLAEIWRDGDSVGLGLPESDAEIVLHTLDIPSEFGVHYLVDDARASVPNGFRVRAEPFRVAIGWCTVLEDPFGNPICLIDMSAGPRR